MILHCRIAPQGRFCIRSATQTVAAGEFKQFIRRDSIISRKTAKLRRLMGIIRTASYHETLSPQHQFRCNSDRQQLAEPGR
jgi:hypothetical protein